MWWKIVLLIITALIALVLMGVGYGSSRWQAQTRELKAAMETHRAPLRQETYDPTELNGLPAPVQRYFRKVLTEGQPLIAAAHVRQEGTFNARPGNDMWSRFTASQDVVTQRPGFVWNADIRMFGVVPVRVHDAYVAGEGILHGALLGLLKVMENRGTPEIAQGELYRYLAEAAWYPTALLPSQGVRWEAVDDSSARVTLADAGTSVTMLFRFNSEDLIESVYTEGRAREENGRMIPTPWEGKWSRYESHNGMLVPMEGEVAWVLPEGRTPYWRGSIIELTYDWAK